MNIQGNYRSDKVQGRTGVVEDTELTVFQDGWTIHTQSVEGMTPGQVWAVIHASHTPTTEDTLTDAEVEWFERAAYTGYVSYGLSVTDGWFVPKGPESFLAWWRKAPSLRANDMCEQAVEMFDQYVATLKAKA